MIKIHILSSGYSNISKKKKQKTLMRPILVFKLRWVIYRKYKSKNSNTKAQTQPPPNHYFYTSWSFLPTFTGIWHSAQICSPAGPTFCKDPKKEEESFCPVGVWKSWWEPSEFFKIISDLAEGLDLLLSLMRRAVSTENHQNPHAYLESFKVETK